MLGRDDTEVDLAVLSPLPGAPGQPAGMIEDPPLVRQLFAEHLVQATLGVALHIVRDSVGEHASHGGLLRDRRSGPQRESHRSGVPALKARQTLESG